MRDTVPFRFPEISSPDKTRNGEWRDDWPTEPQLSVANGTHYGSEGDGRYVSLLGQVSAVAADPKHRYHLVSAIFDLIAEAFELDVFFHYVVNEMGTALELQSSAGIPEETQICFQKLEFDGAIVGEQPAKQPPIFWDRFQRSSLVAAGTMEAIGIKAYACHPLLSGDRLLGTLSFASKRRECFDLEMLECFRAICGIVCLGIARDLASTAQQASEATCKAVFEGASLGVAHGEALTAELWHCNAEFCRTTGYAEAELRGKRLFSLAHPADRIAIREQYEAALCAGNEHWCTEQRWIRKEGEPICVRVDVSFVEEQGGREKRCVIVAEDITARKRDREERDRFFAIGADLLAIAGFDGRFKWVSPVWERVLGWSPAVLTGRPWLHFVHPEDHAATVAEASRGYAGRDSTYFENRYRHADGSWRWLSWKYKVYASEHLIYCGARDITERKLAEEALRQAERQRSDLLATLGNKLRDPIAAITQALRAAEDSSGVETGWPKEAIRRQAAHLSAVLEELLAEYRHESGVVRPSAGKPPVS